MLGLKNSTDLRNVPFKENYDEELLKKIDEYDANFLSYLARLYEAINGEKLDFTNIKSAIDALAKFNERQEFNYLNNLLYPEKCKGVKIPSPIPVPSCSFQLHNSTTVSTNSSGNLAIMFNPFFLASNDLSKTLDYQLTVAKEGADAVYRYKVNELSSFFVNNDDSLTGYEENPHWKPVNIFQMIPPVYNQYRLVSASIVIKYIGRLDIASGVIGGAIVFDETRGVGANGKYNLKEEELTLDFSSVPDILKKYGNFDLAMDSFYYQENLCIEGMRQLYFPIDNSYEEYTKLFNIDLINIDHLAQNDGTKPVMRSNPDYLKNGFKFMVYTLGAPPSSACFKVDIFCNFECLPNAEFLNYLPLSMNVDHITPEQKKEAQLAVQNKPIMKIAEAEQGKPAEKPSIWTRMLNKFRNALPGIGKLIGAGLVKAIPALKPGVAIANAMMSMVTD